MGGQFSLGRKVAFGLIAGVAILLFVSYLSYSNTKRLIEQSKWVDHTNQVIETRMGRTEMKKSTVDLNELLKDALESFEEETRGRKIQWEIQKLPVVEGDAAMLRQVILNLLSNAIKYTGPREEARIEIGHHSNGTDEHLFFIRDNGVGFDMKYADKLFGVFQRLHRVDEFEGTGIGLANIRRIIGRHGGKNLG